MVSITRIRESLIAQLKAKGADVDLYRALIDDYCWMYKQEREMQTDVRKRGRTYKATSASGKEYDKNNPSVDFALKYNKQMMAILDALNLSTDTVILPDGGNEGMSDSDL